MTFFERLFGIEEIEEKKKKQKSSKTAPRQDLSSTVPDKNTVFACDREPIKLIAEKECGGLFPVGVKALYDVPPLSTQLKQAKELKYVKNINSKMTSATINLEKFGTYNVYISIHPRAYRIDRGKESYANPFISEENHNLCLGNSAELYDQCFYSDNFYECIKIIQEVLKSKDNGGEGVYRPWSQC